MRLPREVFNVMENQPNADLLVPKRSVHDQVERSRRVPIGVVKLADAIRSTLVFLPYPLLGLGSTDALAVHDLLDADRRGAIKRMYSTPGCSARINWASWPKITGRDTVMTGISSSLASGGPIASACVSHSCQLAYLRHANP